MLDVEDLRVEFDVSTGRDRAVVKAVNGVSLRIGKGDALGLVGESGSGKSTIGKAVLRLVDAAGGRIRIDGEDVTALRGRALRAMRARVQMIFQDPHSALNPRMTIMRSVAEPVVLHTPLRGHGLRMRVSELLEIVGLPRQFLYRYPHELSGGQKQRVCIARAIALEPALLVLDEPTSALDVSVQAQILEFLDGLKRDLDLTYLFISHNLAVVRILCNRTAVMYLGRIVEEADTETVFGDPRHPYTKALLAAVPLPQAVQPERGAPLEGDVPSPVHLPRGCAFHSRCPEAIAGRCAEEVPAISRLQDGRRIACHLADPSG